MVRGGAWGARRGLTVCDVLVRGNNNLSSTLYCFRVNEIEGTVEN